MEGIAVLAESDVESCRSPDDLEKLAPIGTKSLASEDFFLPRLRLLLEALRGEEAEDCRFEVEVEGAFVVAVAPVDACLPTLAVRDSLTSISESDPLGMVAAFGSPRNIHCARQELHPRRGSCDIRTTTGN